MREDNGKLVVDLRKTRGKRISGWICLLLGSAFVFGFLGFVSWLIEPHPDNYEIYRVAVHIFAAVTVVFGFGVYMGFRLHLREPEVLLAYNDRFVVTYPFRTVTIGFEDITSVEVKITLGTGPASMKMIEQYPEFLFNLFACLLFRARTSHGRYTLWRDKLRSESVSQLTDFIATAFPEEKLIDRTHGFLGPALTRVRWQGKQARIED